MKNRKRYYIAACAGCLALAVQAQTSYNAGTVMENQLNGTARFVGMGGAMSALGADISTMSTNPAGIGLYRSSDIAMTLGWYNPSSKSTFNNETHKDKVSKFSFDQLGSVYSSKLGNRTTLRYVNFGFSYRKANNFYDNFTMEGPVNGNSYSQNMAASLWASGVTADDFNNMLQEKNPYKNVNFGWLNVMGGLTGLLTGEGENDFYGWNSDRTYFRGENKGGIYAYDFNLSCNLNDRVYLGLTIGAYDVDFSRYSSFGENLYAEDDQGQYAASMLLENWYRTDGSGIDAKFGVIFRPFEYSPLRIGLAIHTPTWYNLRDVFSARMTMLGTEGQRITADTRNSGYDESYEYNLRTPWKFNISAGYTIGQSVALDAEYEYADYSSAKFSDPANYDMSANNQTIKEDLKGVSSFRMGVEAKLFEDISLRAGYNYIGALYDKNAYKFNDPIGTRTDIDFMNNYAAHNITLGLGLRFGSFYTDLAYVYTNQKADFHPYSNLIFDEPDPVAKVTRNNHRALLTLGYRF